MQRSTDRILTTHVGSIPRPEALMAMTNTEAGSLYASGPPKDPAAFALRVREAVADVVRKQAKVGLDIVNDGEFSKRDWASYALARMSGFEIRPGERKQVEWLGADLERFYEAIIQDMPMIADGVPVQVCTSPITYTDRAPITHAIDDLKMALSGVKVVEGFLTAVAPASTAFDGVNEYYPNEHDYVFAIAEALREEYLAIHDAGLLIQVDDAVLANMYDHLVRQSPERYREWAQLRVDALNHALRGIPEDRVRYHICFGSWHVPHVSDAPLEAIIGLVLQVKAGAYSIEAANPRHEHEWRVWQTAKLGDGKILIPGVITHHVITVEHPRLVADRIVRFAKLVGRENVIAGADCGFAQADLIKRVHPKVMWAKFESLVEGAKIASDELWGRRAAA